MVLTEQQIPILQALINCIIPTDDFPNGWDAGVGDYLFQQFGGDLKHLVELYQQGLNCLDDEAQLVYVKAFTSLTLDEQTALLTQIEQGQVKSDWTVDPADFFKIVVEHCTEGYYSDPGNGGNRDGIAWQMIGFEIRDDRL